jgi:AraC family transcriptional regulator
MGWVERFEDDGVRVTSTASGSVQVAELCFPPGHRQPRFAPNLGYLAVVLDGDLHKTFPRQSLGLATGTTATIPGGADHTARFGRVGARVLVVKPSAHGSEPVGGLLSRVRARRDPGLSALAHRLAGELSAEDAAAPIAVEGLALGLVTAAVRGSARLSSRPPAWLARVVEQLHANGGGVTIADLAATANVHPAHLTRVFTGRFGVSPATYLRRLRLDRAASTLSATDASLARIAVEEGFADQSHFTRAFKRHTGVTPARYRRLTRGV